jgi:16S rRNA processing protein RimM
MLEVGQITKPHGLRGEVVVKLTTNREERVEKGTVLSTRKGDLTIDHSRPHQNGWIVGFAGVTTREQAEALHGLVLSAEPLDVPGELWVHELMGSEVYDTAGALLGTCTAVEANPASDLIVLDGGGLIPLVFVVDHRPGRTTVDPPPGLLD